MRMFAVLCFVAAHVYKEEDSHVMATIAVIVGVLSFIIGSFGHE